MFIRFDYRCPDCGHEEERFIKKEEMDDQWHESCALDPICESYAHDSNPDQGHMTRLPAATRTNFRFNDKKLKR